MHVFVVTLMCTAGDIKLVIAAKVDVRDGLAWSSLDKYIKNIEGVPAGAASLQPHSSDPEAAAAVAAAGVADREEDAEAAAGAARMLECMHCCVCCLHAG